MILLQKIVLVAFLVQWLAFGVWHYRESSFKDEVFWSICGGFIFAVLSTAFGAALSAAIWFIIFG